jgi:UDP-N-acetylmuramate dehydrogenase
MQIREQVSLKDYSTMRLGGAARYLADITTIQELEQAVAWAHEHQLPLLMIGGGSNIIWRDEGFPGLIAVNKLRGIHEAWSADRQQCTLVIAAGEPWDDVVAHTVDLGLTGLESLSLIPGSSGATPVQNVGAYGQEIANVLASVQAYDLQTGDTVSIPRAECAFGYRTSRFKVADHGRFLITNITLTLQAGNPQPPFYNALQAYFDEQHITTFTPAIVRNAVVAIRQSKLPDPVHIANNGSFFANPIIPAIQFAQLQASHPTIPNWPIHDGQVKIPAAWLLDQTGFKDFHDPETGMGTWPQQPLVLVNEHARSTSQLLVFRQKIIDAVMQTFGIVLEQEPELLP